MFRIVETGGKSIKSMLQKSNPTSTLGCNATACLPCRTGQGEGGNCRASGIKYQVEFQLCPPGQKEVYHGETARNLFTRGGEHEANHRAGLEKSFMHKHQLKKHGNAPGSYIAKVTGSASDCMTRQVREAVHIRRSQVPVLNGKSEWHQPALYTVQNEVYRMWRMIVAHLLGQLCLGYDNEMLKN